jgi:putative CocE/NonD family hydrolase
LYDAYWQSKEIDLEGIETPAYVVASWSDQGLHSRGTLEAFKRMRSREKWLEVHGQKKWAHYYRPESRTRQRAFFDHFLKKRDTLVPAWPAIRIEVRDRAGVAEERAEGEWPLARTTYTPLWLDAGTGALSSQRPHTESQARYDARNGSAVFDIRFDQETELTGHAKLRLWVEAEGADDMDLFVALQKLDRNGDKVGQTFYAFYDDGPVALGWLRASHRALDPARSTPWQPVHPHTDEEPLPAGKAVPVDIEIWPFSTVFHAGESLRVVVQGGDIYTDALPNLPFARHEEMRNRGMHIVRCGGRYDSHLLAPMIPAKEAP